MTGLVFWACQAVQAVLRCVWVALQYVRGSSSLPATESEFQSPGPVQLTLGSLSTRSSSHTGHNQPRRRPGKANRKSLQAGGKACIHQVTTSESTLDLQPDTKVPKADVEPCQSSCSPNSGTTCNSPDDPQTSTTTTAPAELIATSALQSASESSSQTLPFTFGGSYNNFVFGQPALSPVQTASSPVFPAWPSTHHKAEVSPFAASTSGKHVPQILFSYGASTATPQFPAYPKDSTHTNNEPAQSLASPEVESNQSNTSTASPLLQIPFFLLIPFLSTSAKKALRCVCHELLSLVNAHITHFTIAEENIKYFTTCPLHTRFPHLRHLRVTLFARSTMVSDLTAFLSGTIKQLEHLETLVLPDLDAIQLQLVLDQALAARPTCQVMLKVLDPQIFPPAADALESYMKHVRLHGAELVGPELNICFSMNYTPDEELGHWLENGVGLCAMASSSGKVLRIVNGLSRCAALRSLDLQVLDGEALLSAARTELPCLKRLQLAVQRGFLTDQQLFALIAGCVELEELEVDVRDTITPPVLGAFVAMLPPDATLESWSRQDSVPCLPRVRKLSLSHWVQGAPLARVFPNASHVHIHPSVEVNTQIGEHPIRAKPFCDMGSLAGLTSLQWLQLDAHRCDHLEVVSVPGAGVLSTVTGLTRLGFGGYLMGSGLQAALLLQQAQSLPALHTLELDGCIPSGAPSLLTDPPPTLVASQPATDSSTTATSTAVPGNSATASIVASSTAVPGSTAGDSGVASSNIAPATTATGGAVASNNGTLCSLEDDVGIANPSAVPGTTAHAGGIASSSSVPGSAADDSAVASSSAIPGVTATAVADAKIVPGSTTDSSALASSIVTLHNALTSLSAMAGHTMADGSSAAAASAAVLSRFIANSCAVASNSAAPGSSIADILSSIASSSAVPSSSIPNQLILTSSSNAVPGNTMGSTISTPATAGSQQQVTQLYGDAMGRAIYLVAAAPQLLCFAQLRDLTIKGGVDRDANTLLLMLLKSLHLPKLSRLRLLNVRHKRRPQQPPGGVLWFGESYVDDPSITADLADTCDACFRTWGHLTDIEFAGCERVAASIMRSDVVDGRDVAIDWELQPASTFDKPKWFFDSDLQ